VWFRPVLIPLLAPQIALPLWRKVAPSELQVNDPVDRRGPVGQFNRLRLEGQVVSASTPVLPNGMRAAVGDTS